MKKNVDLSKVPVPHGLEEKVAERARQYVEGTVINGLTVKQFSETYGISTSTIYNEHHLKNGLFNRYVHQLTKEVVDGDDISDHLYIAEKIKNEAMKPNANKQDYEMYLKAWGFMFDIMKVQKEKELGFSTGEEKDTRTVDEKKAVLLSRLKG
ncbi:hypothetical protein [Oceanobacillus picturae]|uniref:hypothetical protein n=1 Tax=Oceanobacillus picturae TaxID=171693 RepID=UPI000E690523|nr:hypothetical protein [Oceanobacillus picturae]RIU93305.1 hypothetical protein D1864_07480 [Oceanobacillus picturae]